MVQVVPDSMQRWLNVTEPFEYHTMEPRSAANRRLKNECFRNVFRIDLTEMLFHLVLLKRGMQKTSISFRCCRPRINFQLMKTSN